MTLNTNKQVSPKESAISRIEKQLKGRRTELDSLKTAVENQYCFYTVMYIHTILTIPVCLYPNHLY